MGPTLASISDLAPSSPLQTYQSNPDDLPTEEHYESAPNNLGFPSKYNSLSYLWKGLNHFYERPWFRRIRVYQEVIVAKICQAFVGNTVSSGSSPSSSALAARRARTVEGWIRLAVWRAARS